MIMRKRGGLIEFLCVVGPREGGKIPEVLHTYPGQVRSKLPAALATFCFPRGCKRTRKETDAWSFETILTNADGSRLYAAVLVLSRPDQNGEWTEIALVVASLYGLMRQHRAFLAQLVRISQSDTTSIEAVIATYCRETPAPPRGRCRVLVTLGDMALWCVRPKPNEMPHIDLDTIDTLFTELSAPNVLAVWSALLTENSVALVSDSLGKCGRVAMALLALLFPFNWRGVIIPCCPSSEIDALLDAPVPFLLGGLRQSEYARLRLLPESEVLFVDLDNNHISKDASRLLSQLPQRPSNKLLKRLEEINSQIRTAQDKEFCRNPSSNSSEKIKTGLSLESLPSLPRDTDLSNEENDSELESNDSDGFFNEEKTPRRRLTYPMLGAADQEKRWALAARLEDPITEWSSVHALMVRDDSALVDELGGAHAHVSSISSHVSRSDEHHYASRRIFLAAKASKERRDAFIRFLSAVLMGWKAYLRPTSPSTDTKVPPPTNCALAPLNSTSSSKRGTPKSHSKLLQLVLTSGSVYPKRRKGSYSRGFDAEHFLASRDTNGRGWLAKLIESQMFSSFVAEANSMLDNQKNTNHSITLTQDRSPRVIPRAMVPPHDTKSTVKKVTTTTVPANSSVERTSSFVRNDQTATEASDALLYFHETCTAKLNRSTLQIQKQQTPFLQSNKWRYLDTYIVPPPSCGNSLLPGQTVKHYALRFLNLRAERYPHRPAASSLELWSREAGRSRSAEQMAIVQLLSQQASPKEEVLTSPKIRFLNRCERVQALVRTQLAVSRLKHAKRAASRIQAVCRGVVTRKVVCVAVSAAAERLLIYLFDIWQERDEALLQRSRTVSYSHFEVPPCLGLALLIDELVRLLGQTAKGSASLQIFTTQLSRLKESLPRPPDTQRKVQLLVITAVTARLSLFSFGRIANSELRTPPRQIDTTSIKQSPRFQLATMTPLSQPCNTPSTTRADNVQTGRFFAQPQSSARPRSTIATPRLQSARNIFSPRRPSSVRRPQSTHFAAVPATAAETDATSKNSTNRKVGLYDAIKTMDPAQRDRFFLLFGISEQRLRKRKLAKLVWSKNESDHILKSASLVLSLCQDEYMLFQTPADIHRAARIRKALLASAHVVFLNVSTLNHYRMRP